MQMTLKIVEAILDILRELREYIFLILGFLFGIVGSFVSANPKFQNRVLKIAKVKVHSNEYEIDGRTLKSFKVHYEIVNGYSEPLNFYEMFIEFKDKKIKGNGPSTTSLFEVINPPSGKWYVQNGDTSIQHRDKYSFVIHHRTILEQLEKRKKVKFRLAIGTSRYGDIHSDWKTIKFKYST
jgi:hypothetical protein